MQGGHYALISMSPVDVDATQIDITTIGRPVPEGDAGEKVRAFLEANHTFTLKTLEEDSASPNRSSAASPRPRTPTFASRRSKARSATGTITSKRGWVVVSGARTGSAGDRGVDERGRSCL